MTGETFDLVGIVVRVALLTVLAFGLVAAAVWAARRFADAFIDRPRVIIKPRDRVLRRDRRW